MNTAYMELDTGTIIATENPELWREAKRLPAAEGKRRLRAEAIAELRKTLAPGDTVYTVLRSVSRSGMSRRIDLYKLGADGPIYLSGYAARALGTDAANASDGGIKVDGCGMDMGFHLVYLLSRTLFPDGFGIESESKRRPISREHAAQMVENGYKFHGRNGDASGWDTDGGYALSHRWL